MRTAYTFKGNAILKINDYLSQCDCSSNCAFESCFYKPLCELESLLIASMDVINFEVFDPVASEIYAYLAEILLNI